MKKKTNKKNLKIIIAVVVLLFTSLSVLYVSQVFLKQNNKQKSVLLQTSKEYTSKFLKVTFTYPSNYTLEDRSSRITLSDPKGQIIIESNGTNYQTIDEYLDDLSQKNKFVISDKEKIDLNGKSAVRGNIGEEIYYFIYSDNWTVITVSTKSRDNFDDLERIVQSFHFESSGS